MSTSCKFSGLPLVQGTFLPAEGADKLIGYFADANCLRAWVEKAKPRGWKRRLDAYLAAIGEPVVPAVVPWSVENNPQRVLGPMVSVVAQVSRKRPLMSSSSSAPGPLPVPVPPGEQGKVQLTVVDDGKRSTQFIHFDQWHSLLTTKYRYTLGHVMPVSFNASGTEMTLYPLLVCDGKHVAGTDATVVVAFPAPLRVSMQE